MENLKSELKKLLPRKSSKNYYAEQLGITIPEVEQLLKEIKEEASQTIEQCDSSYKHNHTTDSIEISGIWNTRPTPEKIIEKYSIDTNKYRLSNTWIKDHPKGFLVSVSFLPKTQQEQSTDKFIEFLSTYKSSYIPEVTWTKTNSTFSRKNCAVISLTDFHIDKKNVTKESIEQKVEQYRNTLDILLQKSYHSCKLEEIVFVLGNDFFQTDTIHGTTTSGTPVDFDITWDEAYQKGFELMVESITKAKQYCTRLHVILVSGNHARTKEFYLAHALEVFFKQDKYISFDRSSEAMKIYSYGETLLCFHHGDCVMDKLPLAFATSFYKEWGNCKYKEILLGDKHHSVQKSYKSMDESMGVRMRILPALTGTDQWHKKNLFINSRQAGVAIIYDFEKGKVAEFEEVI